MMTTMQIQMLTGDAYLGAMLFKYFAIAAAEKMPSTPNLTKELDKLEPLIASRRDFLISQLTFTANPA